MIAWMTLRLRKRAIMRRREARAVKKMSDYIKDIQIEKKEVREFDEKNEFPVLPANNYLEFLSHQKFFFLAF